MSCARLAKKPTAKATRVATELLQLHDLNTREHAAAEQQAAAQEPTKPAGKPKRLKATPMVFYLLTQDVSMGVKGLQTFLHEGGVTRQVSWSQEEQTHGYGRTLFIDGNAYAHHSYRQSRLDWILGGQYGAYAGYVRSQMRALLHCGIFPQFYFDGALPKGKVPARIARENERVRTLIRCFEKRDAMTSKSSMESSFADAFFTLPLMAIDTCMSALKDMGIPVFICNEEADSTVAHLAKVHGALAVSKDSDYFIFDLGDGGYVRLDDLHIPTTVVGENTRLKVTALVYDTASIASLLSIRRMLLPVFASILGNDYTETNHLREAIFARKSLHTKSTNAKAKAAISRSLQIQRVLFYLQLFSDEESYPDASSVIAAIAETFGESNPNLSREAIERSLNAANAQYNGLTLRSTPVSVDVEGERSSRQLLDIVATQTFWCSPILEDTTLRSSWLFGRWLRQWAYTILLSKINDNRADSEDITVLIYALDHTVLERHTIQEYVRKADHITSDEVSLPSQDELLEFVSHANNLVATKHTAFASKEQNKSLLQSNYSLYTSLHQTVLHACNSLPPVWLPFVSVMRYMILHSARKTFESSKMGKLADYEVVSFVVMALKAYRSVQAQSIASPLAGGSTNHSFLITKRAIELTAYYQTTLFSSYLLAQALGISEQLLKNQMLSSLYDGQLFYHCLARLKGGMTPSQLCESLDLDANTIEMLNSVIRAIYHDMSIADVDLVFHYGFTHWDGEETPSSDPTKRSLGKLTASRTRKKRHKKSQMVAETGKPHGDDGQNLFGLLSTGCDF